MILAAATTAAFGAELAGCGGRLEIGKACATVISFRQLILLDHGAHGTIQYQDAAGH